MKAPNASKMDCTPEQIDEAAVWMALLHSQERNARTEFGFQRWLKAHPAHALAFEQVSMAHEITGAIALKPLPPADLLSRRKPMRSSSLGNFAMAAVVGGLAIAGVLYYAVGGKRYATEVGEQRTLSLNDGTQVVLNTNSGIAVHYDEQYRSVELTKGEALFEVAAGQPNRPFVVMAGERRITALGTTFLVKMTRHPGAPLDQFEVTLIEGKIAVDDVVLEPGQRLTATSGAQPALDRPTLQKMIAWRSGRVEFDQVPLADAVAEMNRYSVRHLVVQQPEAAAVVITGTFRAGAVASFAQAMAAAYRLQVVETPDRITLAGQPGPVSQPATLP